MFVLIVVVLFFLGGLDRIMGSFRISFDTSVVLLFIVILFGNLNFFSFLKWASESSSHIKDTDRSYGLLLLLGQEGFQLVLPLGQVQNQSLELGILSLKVFDG